MDLLAQQRMVDRSYEAKEREDELWSRIHRGLGISLVILAKATILYLAWIGLQHISITVNFLL